MALDPLKFKIAIERGQLKQELADAKRELENGLKDVPITIKIANLETIKQQLANLEVKVNVSGSSNQKKQMEGIKTTISELEKLLTMQEKVESALMRMKAAGGGKNLVAGFDDAHRKLREFSDRLNKVDYNNVQAIRDIKAEWQSLGSIVAEVTKKQEKANTADASLMGKYEKSLQQAKKSLADVDILLNKLEKSSKSASSLGIDVAEIQKRIAILRQYRETVEKIANGTMQAKDFKDVMGGNFFATIKQAKDELQQLNKQIKEAEKVYAQAEKEARKNAAAVSAGIASVRQLAAEEQKLSSAIQKTIGEMNHQSQVLNDLKTMAFQYLSVYGAQQFLNNIIEIGGQLEMQRLSIGAILQDTAQANDLFDKIKGLALQSPFGVVELDQFTKQLSAYGFKYNELFDMTKRLADISAGAGTDVSRLALALGHVRAEGALTGYTLRQFAMNNIPMLSKLSEKLSELEGRIVTASEVRQRVRNKEIDYSMVESVIKDLTNEGGMFYNMQEVISGSVKAKWKNLRDAFDIMYGEMAESALGGTLKDTATILTSMAKRWKELGTVVFNVAKAYGAYKTVMLVYNTMLGQQARAVLNTIAAQRQAKAANLQMAASYRSLTAAEQGQLLTSTKLSLADKVRMITNRQSAAIIRERIALTQKARIEEIAMAVSTKQLGAEEIARAVALGKLNKNVALLAIGNSKLHATEIASMQATVASVRTYGMLTGVVNTTAMAFTRLGIALKGLLMNPATWIFALIAGLTDLWQRNNQEMERAKELSKSLAERAAEGVKNVNMMMGETGMTYKVNGKETQFSAIPGGQISHTPSSSMDSDAMIQTMEKWEEFIKNYSSMPNTLLQNALFDGDKLRSVTEQYENLAAATESVMKSQQALAQIADKAQFIMDYTNEGLDGDDLVANMDDYAKKIRKADVEVSKFASHHKGAMIAALNAAKSNKTFADSLAYANKMMQEKEGRNLTEEEQIKWLTKYYGDFEVAIRQAEQAIGDLGDKEAMKSFVSVQKASKGENQAEVTLVKDMELAADAIRQTVKEKWHKDISELEEYEKQALLQMVSDIAAKSGESTEVIREKIMNLFAKVLKIPVDIKDVDAHVRISQLQEELTALMGGPNGDGWPIDIKGVVDAPGLVQKVREAYKKAKDTINNMAPIAIKMGFSLGQVKVMTEEDIKNAAGGSVFKEMALRAMNEAYKSIAAAEKASNTYGFSLIDPNSGGKVFRDKKGKRGDSKSSQKDPEAERLRKMMKVLKEAGNSYQYWRKQVGDKGAFAHVEKEFGELLRELGLNVTDADKLKKKLQELNVEFGKKPKTKQMVEALKELDKELAELNRKDFEKAMEFATSKMKRDIDDLTRKWEMFNSVREKTGDIGLAAALAGVDRNKFRNSADNMIDVINTMLLEMGNQSVIDFGKVASMSDDEIEKYAQENLGISQEYEQHIKSIIDALIEWKNLNNSVQKQDVDNYSQLIGQAVNYEAQIKKVNDAFYKQKEALDALLRADKISQGQYNVGINRISATKARGLVEALPEYKMLMDGVLSITKKTAEKVKKEMMDALYKQLISGTITAKEYADKIREINERMEQLEQPRSNLGAYLEGGISGLINKMRTDANDMTRKGGASIEMGMFNMHQGANGGGMQQIVDGFNQLSEGNKMTQIGQGMQQAAGNFANTIMIIDKIIHGIDGIIQGLKQTYDQITDMLDALGSESAKDPRSGWGKAGTALSALSSGSQYATKGWDSLKNGDIGGVISGVVGSFTGPITAIAQAHDARRQAAIDELVFEVKKISNTLNLIHTARERTLGYDNGNYRREMARMYAAGFGNSNSPMIEFYSRGGLEGSGYTQELEALKKQREDYIKMYNEENSKKKESKEALEEYKMKIAELDDQIQNYAMDLANELWSIDLKGWADQIGDALMNAFENGTSAAEAFKDATKNIMQSVVSEMLKKGFMQPMFDKLQEKLFGENGAFNYENPKSSMGATIEAFKEFIETDGQNFIIGANEFLSGVEGLLNQGGMSIKNTSQATQTQGIQSLATEESIGILSGQMARIAQDVSVKRIFITQIATEQMPKLLESAQMQQTLLENQFQSVRAIEHAIVDGDGALYASIDKMSRKIDRAITPEGRMRIE